jgi:hypothetical protein
LQKIVFIIVLSFLITGCSALKKSAGKGVFEKSISENGLVDATIGNNLSERNFYISKAEVVASSGGISTKFLASIKFKKPDSMLLVIRSIIGTEVARALLTKDTIMLNDRINKVLLIGRPGIRTLKYGISPDIFFVVLGDLVLNKEQRNKQLLCEDGYSKVSFPLNGKTIDYSIDCRRQKVNEARIEEDVFSGEIKVRIKKFLNLNGFSIPGKIEVSDPDADSGLNIEIDKIEPDWKGKIEFIPGRNYSVKIIR